MNLTIKPLKQKDASKGLAAIDASVMDELALENGDYISLESTHDSEVLRVWPGYPEDEDRNVIRIDGQTRQSLNVSIDEKIEISTANIQPAKSITVAIPDNIGFRGNVNQYFRSNLVGQAVESGKTVSIPINPEQAIPAYIVEATPNDYVVVTDFTYIEFSNHSTEYWRDLEEKSWIGTSVHHLTNHISTLFNSITVPGSVVMVGIIVVLSTIVVGGSYLLSVYTPSSFLDWISGIGPLMIVILSGLTIYYQRPD